MSDRILVGTRKGLFDVRRSGTGWGVHKVHFLGDPVSAVARDPLSGAIYAALALGHFGVKLWMTADDGASGSAAALTIRASIRCASIRAFPITWCSASPAGAYG